MNREQASALITQTFTRAFDKTRFGNFAINLLNRIDGSKAQAWNSQYIKDAFKDHVHRYERLGTYTSPDKEKLDVLIVYLTKESKLERARTAIRNFVAHHLKTRDEKEAALVAFVSPTEKQWRFSYVKMDYATVENESGKVGIETRLTPARRFSYLVGEGESSHTAQTRFVGPLQDTATDPTLADIEETFSVEAVTKEFFTKYAELFGAIHKALEKLVGKDQSAKEEFKSKGLNTVDFAKKLMGQIVFLYFLQKKGWLGVAKGQDWGTGPHDFLRRLANGEHGKYDNFFNDVLEPLFYDSLAIDRGHDAWCKHFKCRIPFLNGGLFEPPGDYNWRKAGITIPNKLFTNTDFVEEGIIGTGVLDVFDRYNFTVNEAEPLEKEVAIDPEMLGKVFENLIEDNRRRGLGAYYTPREIVHYMCQQSLINYLDSTLNTSKDSFGPVQSKQPNLFGQAKSGQDLLKADGQLVPRADIETFIHLGDQAALYEAARMSGTTSYALHLPKSIENNARLIDEKFADIAICDPAVGSGAFPVGMMTEIVRSRSSLTPYFNDVHERTPYHFKRHAIQNCLYGVDIDPGAVEIAKLRLWLSLVVDEEEVKHIKPLPNLDYKIVAGNSLVGFPFKSPRLNEIERLKAQFFEEVDHERRTDLKHQIDRNLSECFASSKKTLGYEVGFDFGIYFSEVFARKKGFDAVIANPPYIDSEAMTKDNPELRRLIQASYSMTKGNWDIYIAFYEKGFGLLGPQGVLSFITPDKWISKPFGDEMRVRTKDRMFSILKAGRSVFESVNVDAIVSVFTSTPQPFIRIYEFGGADVKLKRVVRKEDLESPYAYDWLFSDFLELLTKMNAHSERLSARGMCENACATSDAYKLKDFLEEGPKNPKQDEYLQIINTGTIGKYVSKWGRREMVYLGNRYSRPMVHRKRFLDAFRNSYGRKAVKQKLIVKGLNLLDACLDSRGSIIPGKTTLIITSEDLEELKILLAVINSSAAFFFLKEKYPASSYNQGTTFTKEMINNLPLPTISPGDRVKLISTVDRIVLARESNPEASTAALEKAINLLVFGIYGLSPADIRLVEQSNAR